MPKEIDDGRRKGLLSHKHYIGHLTSVYFDLNISDFVIYKLILTAVPFYCAVFTLYAAVKRKKHTVDVGFKLFFFTCAG